MKYKDMINLLNDNETLVIRKIGNKVFGHISFDEDKDDFLFYSKKELKDYLQTNRLHMSNPMKSIIKILAGNNMSAIELNNLMTSSTYDILSLEEKKYINMVVLHKILRL